MARFKVGVQLHPQHTTMDVLAPAWREADAMGVDTIWTWDHFYPLYGGARRRALRGMVDARGDGVRHRAGRSSA